MRRLFASLLASSFLLPLVGCNHIAGRCDCANGLDACCNNGWGWIGQAAPVIAPPVLAAPAPAAEPIRVMPKVEDKGN
jgi:hypothetical protein